jgi:hypothetical protein
MIAKNISSFVFILLLMLTGCTGKVILIGHNFKSGDWLLVNQDFANGTQKIIDDEKVLVNNPTGIKVDWSEDHKYTTCDGILKLYKDGELIAQQGYLEQSYLTENMEIKAAYKNCSVKTTHPHDSKDFKKQWDSLRTINNCYPTRYHIQPEDKDIILFYIYD